MRISTMQLLDPKVTNSLWVLTPASTRRHTRHLSLQARCQLGVHLGSRRNGMDEDTSLALANPARPQPNMGVG
jgi:hypothetical protein